MNWNSDPYGRQVRIPPKHDRPRIMPPTNVHHIAQQMFIIIPTYVPHRLVNIVNGEKLDVSQKHQGFQLDNACDVSTLGRNVA